jgi:hypothetical protein
VEEIEDGVAARFVGVEAGRKKNAVGDRAMEDSAGERIAFGARSSEGGWEVKEVEEVEEVKERVAGASGR